MPDSLFVELYTGLWARCFGLERYARKSSPGQLSLFGEHDVSQEPRDAHGEWTAGGAQKSEKPDVVPAENVATLRQDETKPVTEPAKGGTMGRTKATHRLVASGNTRPAKEALKAKGWKYDPATQTWYMMLVDAHAERIPADEEFFRGLGGHRKGVLLTLDGQQVWKSKTHGQPAVNSAPPSGTPDPDGFGWNTDAAGNPMPSNRIPGSAPDDMI